MKSFKQYITEAKKDKDPSVRRLGGPTRELSAPDGTKVITNMPEPSKVPTDEVIDRLERNVNNVTGGKSGGRTASPSRPRGATATADDVGSFVRSQQETGKPKAVSDTLQDTAARKKAGYDFPQNVGTEKPRPTKPGSYVVSGKPRRANRIPGATGGKTTGSLSKGNLSFPGDRSGAYAREKAKIDAREKAKIDGTSTPSKSKPKPVKQSEVSKKIKASLQGAQSSKSSSPSTPSTAQLKKFTTGQQKGYIWKVWSTDY